MDNHGNHNLNGFGEEPVIEQTDKNTNTKHKKSKLSCKEKRKEIKEKNKKNQNYINALNIFRVWLTGFFVSLLPLLTIPFSRMATGIPFEDSFSGMFSDKEIIFMGISITVSAINDFSYTQKSNSTMWLLGNILWLIVGASAYGILVVLTNTNPNTINERFILYFNILYIFLCFVLGFVKYVKNICENKEG